MKGNVTRDFMCTLSNVAISSGRANVSTKFSSKASEVGVIMVQDSALVNPLAIRLLV